VTASTASAQRKARLPAAFPVAWPGPDLRPVPGRAPATVVYGLLSPAFFETLKGRRLARLRRERIAARLRDGER
jgi:hypothetical protein